MTAPSTNGGILFIQQPPDWIYPRRAQLSAYIGEVDRYWSDRSVFCEIGDMIVEYPTDMICPWGEIPF